MVRLPTTTPIRRSAISSSPSISAATQVSGYRRELDLSTALVSVSFKSGGTTFHRQTFASAADGVIVHRLVADKKGAIRFGLKLDRIERASTRFEAPDTLVMTGNTGDTLNYEVRAKVLHKGGKITGNPDGTLNLEGADDATVLIAAATNFVLDYDKGYTGGDLSTAATRINAAAAKDYIALREAHVAEYTGYFNRLKLDLGKQDTRTPTDVRLQSYFKNPDPAFATLFYQFGRYLLISSSRPDNPLPSNTQGIWGDGLDLPWKCDYKSNINYQMIYWAAEASNLGEMHKPMLRMTQNLVKPGTRTAQAYFGPDTPGWVVGYTTNGWSWTSPGERLNWGDLVRRQRVDVPAPVGALCLRSRQGLPPLGLPDAQRRVRVLDERARRGHRRQTHHLAIQFAGKRIRHRKRHPRSHLRRGHDGEIDCSGSARQHRPCRHRARHRRRFPPQGRRNPRPHPPAAGRQARADHGVGR